jgi:uncharacterized protein
MEARIASADAPVPVQPGERIAALDILRAFALLGILVMNMDAFASTWWLQVMPEARWPAWYDHAAIFIKETFFDGKFNSLFSLLFGIGFTIQLDRLMARSAHPVAVYLRRIVILLIIGLLHAFFLWTGDVLHAYAVLGIFLVFVRKASNRLVIVLLVLGLVWPTVRSTWTLTHYTADDEKADRAQVEVMQRDTLRAYGEGSYAEATVMRFREMKEIYSDPRSLSYYPLFFTTMLLGVVAGRRRIIQDAAKHRALIRRTMWWSLAAGLFFALLVSSLRPLLEPFKPSPLGVLVSTAYGYQRPALMLFYACAIVLLCLNERWGRILAPLRFTGRMPLTNYLMQSVICTLIFYGYGLGFYERVGPALCLVLALVIFPVQVLTSIWWFRHFRFGPAEWLWRTLTYGAAPRMRLEPAESPAA